MWVIDQHRTPAALLTGEEPPVHIVRDIWFTIWSRGKCRGLNGNRVPAIQPVVCRCTVRDIPAIPYP